MSVAMVSMLVIKARHLWTRVINTWSMEYATFLNNQKLVNTTLRIE